MLAAEARAPAHAPETVVRWRAVALPVEHGGWGLLAEPVIAGLLLAPSLAGAGLGLAGVAAFLARHPLKLAASDWWTGRRVPRTPVAERFALVYTLVAAVGLGLAAAGRQGFWLPLAAALPLALLQLSYDVRNRGRQLLPELAGGIALGSLAAAELMAAGFSPAPALSVWALLSVKALGAVVYVRTRVRLDRGLAASARPAMALHVVSLAAATALAAAGLGPWLAAAGFALLLARAAQGLSARRRPLPPKSLGWRELGFSAAFLALLVLGWRLGC